MKRLFTKIIMQLERTVFAKNFFATVCSSRAIHSLGLQKFCADLKERQLIANSHPPDICDSSSLQKLAALPNVLYAGFDATSDSLHVGNLCIINSLLRAVLYGCKAILLVGRTTALAGDPSGRSSARTISTQDIVSANANRIQTQLETIIANFKAHYDKRYGEQITLVCNSSWYDKMSMEDFLHIGHSFHIGNMLRLAPIKKRMRLGDKIDYSEFSYQNLQAIDWLQLAKNYNCCFQIGGSDQLGNFDVGYNYIRSSIGKLSAAVGLVLVTSSSGEKLGKSVTDPNASVWLSPNKTSPFAFFQFWRQRPDKEPLQEVDKVLEEHEANLGSWIAQEYLAVEMTRLVHGECGLQLARDCTKALFHNSWEELRTYSIEEIKSLFGQASTHFVGKSEVTTVGNLADKIKSGLPTGTDVVKAGGFKLNGRRYADENAKLNFDELFFGGKCITVVTWGKRNHELVVWVD